MQLQEPFQAQYLAQGHFDMLRAGIWDQTNDLRMPGAIILPHEMPVASRTESIVLAAFLAHIYSFHK